MYIAELYETVTFPIPVMISNCLNYLYVKRWIAQSEWWRLDWCLRTCVSVSVVTLIYFLPHARGRGDFAERGLEYSFAAFVTVLVKDETVGATVANSWACILGALLATLLSWAAFELFIGAAIAHSEALSASVTLVALGFSCFLLQYMELPPMGRKLGVSMLALNLLALRYLPNPTSLVVSQLLWGPFEGVLFGIGCGLVGTVLPPPAKHAGVELRRRARYFSATVSSLLEGAVGSWRAQACSNMPLIHSRAAPHSLHTCGSSSVYDERGRTANRHWRKLQVLLQVVRAFNHRDSRGAAACLYASAPTSGSHGGSGGGGIGGSAYGSFYTTEGEGSGGGQGSMSGEGEMEAALGAGVGSLNSRFVRTELIRFLSGGLEVLLKRNSEARFGPNRELALRCGRYVQLLRQLLLVLERLETRLVAMALDTEHRHVHGAFMCLPNFRYALHSYVARIASAVQLITVMLLASDPIDSPSPSFMGYLGGMCRTWWVWVSATNRTRNGFQDADIESQNNIESGENMVEMGSGEAVAFEAVQAMGRLLRAQAHFDAQYLQARLHVYYRTSVPFDPPPPSSTIPDIVPDKPPSTAPSTAAPDTSPTATGTAEPPPSGGQHRVLVGVLFDMNATIFLLHTSTQLLVELWEPAEKEPPQEPSQTKQPHQPHSELQAVVAALIRHSQPKPTIVHPSDRLRLQAAAMALWRTLRGIQRDLIPSQRHLLCVRCRWPFLRRDTYASASTPGTPASAASTASANDTDSGGCWAAWQYLFLLLPSCEVRNVDAAHRTRMLTALKVVLAMLLAAAYGIYAQRPQPFLASFTIAYLAGGAVAGANVMTCLNRAAGTAVACVYVIMVLFLAGWSGWQAHPAARSCFVGAAVVLFQLPATYVRTYPMHSYSGTVAGFTVALLLLDPALDTTLSLYRIIDTYVGVGIYLSVEFAVAASFTEDKLLENMRRVFQAIDEGFGRFHRGFLLGAQHPIPHSQPQPQPQHAFPRSDLRKHGRIAHAQRATPTTAAAATTTAVAFDVSELFRLIRQQRTLVPFYKSEPSGILRPPNLPDPLLHECLRLQEEAAGCLQVMHWAVSACDPLRSARRQRVEQRLLWADAVLRACCGWDEGTDTAGVEGVAGVAGVEGVAGVAGVEGASAGDGVVRRRTLRIDKLRDSIAMSCYLHAGDQGSAKRSFAFAALQQPRKFVSKFDCEEREEKGNDDDDAKDFSALLEPLEAHFEEVRRYVVVVLGFLQHCTVDLRDWRAALPHRQIQTHRQTQRQRRQYRLLRRSESAGESTDGHNAEPQSGGHVELRRRAHKPSTLGADVAAVGSADTTTGGRVGPGILRSSASKSTILRSAIGLTSTKEQQHRAHHQRSRSIGSGGIVGMGGARGVGGGGGVAGSEVSTQLSQNTLRSVSNISASRSLSHLRVLAQDTDHAPRHGARHNTGHSIGGTGHGTGFREGKQCSEHSHVNRAGYRSLHGHPHTHPHPHQHAHHPPYIHLHGQPKPLQCRSLPPPPLGPHPVDENDGGSICEDDSEPERTHFSTTPPAPASVATSAVGVNEDEDVGTIQSEQIDRWGLEEERDVEIGAGTGTLRGLGAPQVHALFTAYQQTLDRLQSARVADGQLRAQCDHCMTPEPSSGPTADPTQDPTSAGRRKSCGGHTNPNGVRVPVKAATVVRPPRGVPSNREIVLVNTLLASTQELVAVLRGLAVSMGRMQAHRDVLVSQDGLLH